MRTFLLLLLCLIPAMDAFATEYYVATSGSDDNPGTRALPWRSVAKANRTLSAGDTVYLREGIYWRDEIEPVNSGTPGRPIVYKAFPGETPIIDMGTPFTQRWTKVSGRDGVDAVYEAPFPHSEGAFYSIAENDTSTSGRYTMWWRKDGCCTSRMGPNTVNAIEGPGQFYFVGDRIRARGARSSNLNDSKLVGIGDTGDVAIVLDRSHITIDGITFRNMGAFAIRSNTTPISHFTLQNCVIRHLAFTAYLNRIEHVVWRNNTFDGLGTYMRDSGEVGFTTDSRQVLIENNTFAWGGHNALYLGNRSTLANGDNAHFIVRGNTFRDGGRQILVRKVHDIVIEDNEFMFSAPRSESMTRLGRDNQAIKIYGSRAIVRNNRIWAHGGGGIYILAIGNSDVEIIHANDNHVYHNTVIDGRGDEWGGIVLHKGMDQVDGQMKRNVIVNNIVWNNSIADFQFLGHARDSSNVIENNLTSDPRLVSYRPGNGWPSRDSAADRNPDLRPAHDSPAIDAAIPLTRATSNGSGKVVQVEDSRFFTDGYGLVEGDHVLVGSNGPTRIVDIDHAASTLTLERSISWRQNDPVYLPYTGIAPDIGAVEYLEHGAVAVAPKAPQLMW